LVPFQIYLKIKQQLPREARRATFQPQIYTDNADKKTIHHEDHEGHEEINLLLGCEESVGMMARHGLKYH
jgi:hypothetical protein